MFPRALIVFLLVVLPSLRATDSLFFGEIPIQYASPGEIVRLDLHRFLHPPTALVKTKEATFDPTQFSLTIKAPDAGIKTVALEASDGDSNFKRFVIIAVSPRRRLILRSSRLRLLNS